MKQENIEIVRFIRNLEKDMNRLNVSVSDLTLILKDTAIKSDLVKPEIVIPVKSTTEVVPVSQPDKCDTEKQNDLFINYFIKQRLINLSDKDIAIIIREYSKEMASNNKIMSKQFVEDMSVKFNINIPIEIVYRLNRLYIKPKPIIKKAPTARTGIEDNIIKILKSGKYTVADVQEIMKTKFEVNLDYRMIYYIIQKHKLVCKKNGAVLFKNLSVNDKLQLKTLVYQLKLKSTPSKEVKKIVYDKFKTKINYKQIAYFKNKHTILPGDTTVSLIKKPIKPTTNSVKVSVFQGKSTRDISIEDGR